MSLHPYIAERFRRPAPGYCRAIYFADPAEVIYPGALPALAKRAKGGWYIVPPRVDWNDTADYIQTSYPTRRAAELAAFVMYNAGVWKGIE